MSSEPRAITTIKPLRDAYLNKRGNHTDKNLAKYSGRTDHSGRACYYMAFLIMALVV